MWKEKRDERDRWRKKEEEEGKGSRSCELYNLIKKKGVRRCKNFARRFEIMIECFERAELVFHAIMRLKAVQHIIIFFDIDICFHAKTNISRVSSIQLILNHKNQSMTKKGHLFQWSNPPLS